MSLNEILKKEFFIEYNRLKEEELKYLREDPFKTEKCLDCSHYKGVGVYNRNKDKFELADDTFNGEPCCDISGKLEPIEAPSECSLTPEGALKWFFGKDNVYTMCPHYDGPKMYPEVQIEDFIEKRDEIIKKVAGEQFLEEYKETVGV